MYDNYHYPAGADTPDAPWNQSDPEDMDFEITCSQSLSKTVTVTTNNYIPGASGVDYERDDEGGTCAIPWHDDPDTSDTCWADEYHSNDYHTPLQLINLFKRFLTDELNVINNGGTPVHDKKSYLERLIDECSGWTNDEEEFIEN